MMNRFETYYDANYTYYTTQNRQILKSLGLFENLALVIMSTRENIRLIARASLLRQHSEYRDFDSTTLCLAFHHVTVILKACLDGMILSA